MPRSEGVTGEGAITADELVGRQGTEGRGRALGRGAQGTLSRAAISGRASLHPLHPPVMRLAPV